VLEVAAIHTPSVAVARPCCRSSVFSNNPLSFKVCLALFPLIAARSRLRACKSMACRSTAWCNRPASLSSPFRGCVETLQAMLYRCARVCAMLYAL
jgi:hypothetical protein